MSDKNKTEYFCFDPIYYDGLKAVEKYLYHQGSDQARDHANWLNQVFFENLEELTTKDMDKIRAFIAAVRRADEK